MLNAGALNQRITLQRAVATRDATGDDIVSWTTVRDVWARVIPIRGREAFVQGVSLSEMDTRFLVRWASDLAAMDSRWRVLHRGRVYDLVSVAEAHMGRELLELLAKTGASEG
jgi:SPP1 family predicted phage head-tail adaptor